MILVVGVQRIDGAGGCSGRGTDTLSLFRNSGEAAAARAPDATQQRASDLNDVT